MNILLASNERYFVPTKVMLTSLLENNTFENHNIYFLYNEMKESSVNILKQYVESNYNAKFFDNKIDIESFADFPISHHFSIETYFRFLVRDIVPKKEDRVLWLDVDMIIRKTLKNFYYQEFAGKALVVCASINKNPQVLLEKLKCPTGTTYFNAGMILFNMREVDKFSLHDYREFYEKNRDNITWLDQDILNAMYALNTKVVDYKKYNMQFFNETKFEQSELNYIKNETAILHFIGKVKPWHEEYENVCGKYWRVYAKKAFSLSERVRYVYRLYKKRLKKKQRLIKR